MPALAVCDALAVDDDADENAQPRSHDHGQNPQALVLPEIPLSLKSR